MYFLSLIISFLLPSHEFAHTEEACLNEEEAKLYSLVNEYRDEKGLPAIPFSAKLTKVAQAHVRDLAMHYDISKSDRCNPHSWSKKGEWTACCYTNDHKKAQCMWDKPSEIAGYESSGYEIAYYGSAGANAQEGIAGWKKSKSHNPLLINSGIWKDIKWGAIGVGIYEEYGVIWFGELTDSQNEYSVCSD